MDTVTVYKLDHQGREVYRYDGRVVARAPDRIQIEARFEARDQARLGPILLRRGDRMVEWFYADRWYNIFEIHAAADDGLKGWYCNITRPAALDAATVRADDLALDLVVMPGGEVVLVDEDEFEALDIPPADRAAALTAVDDLRRAVAARQPPFDSDGA